MMASHRLTLAVVGMALCCALNSQAGVPEGNAAFAKSDYATATKEWRAAAQQGDAEGQYKLATAYSIGFGVEFDMSKAAYWLSLAVRQGHPAAMSRLASMYYLGSGVTEDEKLAMALFNKAAELGDPEAQFSLGQHHDFCEGRDHLPQDDLAVATQWYRKAADP
jgi:TPR repeat protein